MLLADGKRELCNMTKLCIPLCQLGRMFAFQDQRVNWRLTPTSNAQGNRTQLRSSDKHVPIILGPPIVISCRPGSFVALSAWVVLVYRSSTLAVHLYSMSTFSTSPWCAIYYLSLLNASTFTDSRFDVFLHSLVVNDCNDQAW